MFPCVVLWDWWGTLVSSCGPIDAAERALGHWCQKARCAVVTNGLEMHTASEVRSLRWSRYIECIQGGEEFQKPDPRIIYSALKRLCVGVVEHVVMIGDSQTDRQCAESAGCKSLLVGVDVTLQELSVMTDVQLINLASQKSKCTTKERGSSFAMHIESSCVY